MKQELMNLNNDELQNRWKAIVTLTCCQYRVKQIEESWESMRKAMKAFSDAMERLFVPIKELAEVFNSKDSKSYSHSFPHHVDNLKLNTRGFPQPVIKCARSRC